MSKDKERLDSEREDVEDDHLPGVLEEKIAVTPFWCGVCRCRRCRCWEEEEEVSKEEEASHLEDDDSKDEELTITLHITEHTVIVRLEERYVPLLYSVSDVSL